MRPCCFLHARKCCLPPPYRFHGGVPDFREVFLGTIVVLDGGHYQQLEELLSLVGAARQC